MRTTLADLQVADPHARTAPPKPRPARLERADKRRHRRTEDEAENKKARQRAGGRCEIVVVGEGRCTRRDTQTHHLIGGWGSRARGDSILAKHKQRACNDCHANITGHVLKRIGGPTPLWTDRYERER